MAQFFDEPRELLFRARSLDGRRHAQGFARMDNVFKRSARRRSVLVVTMATPSPIPHRIKLSHVVFPAIADAADVRANSQCPCPNIRVVALQKPQRPKRHIGGVTRARRPADDGGSPPIAMERV